MCLLDRINDKHEIRSMRLVPLVYLELVVVCMEPLLPFCRWHTFSKFPSWLLDLLVFRISLEWWLRYP